MNENILYVVHCVDTEGPLDEKLEDTFERVNKIFGLELKPSMEVLEKLQKLEPIGVFARNLGECLRLQLREKGLLNDSIEVITNNLQYLAKGEIQKLCKIAKVNLFNLYY